MKLGSASAAATIFLAILAILACTGAATPAQESNDAEEHVAATIVAMPATQSPPSSEPAAPAVSSTAATPVSRMAVGNTFEEPLSSGLSVADVVENALPSVVHIIAGSGTGTGFIVDESGLVVTNKHVVDETSQVTLRLASGANFQGRVSERHPSLDLAYIEIDANRSFASIAIGDSEEIRVGETVIAIGFPLGRTLGLEPTVSVGIVSAKRGDRLQTDAALNPGNSGGPLLDTFGKVVGVVTSRLDTTVSGRTVSGISFAIPINVVKSRLGEQVSVSATPTATPSVRKAGRTRGPDPKPTVTRRATHAPMPTSTLSPAPTPTSIPWEPLFDYSKLLPKTEPKPNWQIAVERWKSFEWFEQVCSTGEVFEVAGRNGRDVPGKGAVSRIEYYEEPFPKAEFTLISHETSGLGPNEPGLVYMSDGAFETFGITCVLIDKHVDVTFACYYDASCTEKMKMEILSDQLGLVLLQKGGWENAVGVLMRCSDGSNECSSGGIWMVSFSPPSHSNIIEYQRRNRSN